MKKITLIAAILLFGATRFFAQNGGKAEPLRIVIPNGQTRVAVAGNLKENEQAEYVFGAQKDQQIFVSVDSVKPLEKFCTFVVKGVNNNFASNLPRFSVEKFQAAETGDYLIFIKFRPIGKTKRGTYKLTLEIK